MGDLGSGLLVEGEVPDGREGLQGGLHALSLPGQHCKGGRERETVTSRPLRYASIRERKECHMLEGSYIILTLTSPRDIEVYYVFSTRTLLTPLKVLHLFKISNQVYTRTFRLSK